MPEITNASNALKQGAESKGQRAKGGGERAKDPRITELHYNSNYLPLTSVDRE
jgi:hypothetical protein